jgi:hypothetical protein
MTREEAIRLLGGDEDVVADEYEQKLFEFKQYFLSKPLVSKLYEGQFKKLAKLELAGRVLGLTGEPTKFTDSSMDFSDDILLSFSHYESEKARVKARVVNCKTAHELIFWTGCMLKIQKAYLRLWPETAELNLDEIVIGREPDPMELLNDMKELRRMGTLKFDQLSISSCETLVTFYNEWKRLSLLRQKELEWTKASSIN